jgi:hypothetical protein
VGYFLAGAGPRGGRGGRRHGHGRDRRRAGAGRGSAAAAAATPRRPAAGLSRQPGDHPGPSHAGIHRRPRGGLCRGGPRSGGGRLRAAVAHHLPYRPPCWPEDAHLPLNPVTYGDFLQLALAGRARAAFWRPGRPERIYRVLNGNARGLGVIAAALAMIDPEDEGAFLDKLAEAGGAGAARPAARLRHAGGRSRASAPWPSTGPTATPPSTGCWPPGWSSATKTTSGRPWSTGSPPWPLHGWPNSQARSSTRLGCGPRPSTRAGSSSTSGPPSSRASSSTAP